MNNEIWRDIPKYIGSYQASNYGRIRSLDRYVSGRKGGEKRFIKGKILALDKHRFGYMRVSVSKDGKSKMERVHRLVAFAFLGTPDKGMVVNHIDLDKENNCANNLEWVSHKKNSTHAVKNGAIKSSGDCYNSSLSNRDAILIVVDTINGMSYSEVAKKYHVTNDNVSRIVRGVTYSTVTNVPKNRGGKNVSQFLKRSLSHVKPYVDLIKKVSNEDV